MLRNIKMLTPELNNLIMEDFEFSHISRPCSLELIEDTIVERSKRDLVPFLSAAEGE